MAARCSGSSGARTSLALARSGGRRRGATALFEAVWYQFRNGIDVMEVLGADLSFDDGPGPSGMCCWSACVLVALRLARPLWAKRPQPARALGATTRMRND